MFQPTYYHLPHSQADFYPFVKDDNDDDDDIPLSQCCVIDETLFYVRSPSDLTLRRPSAALIASRRPSQAPSTLLDDTSDDDDEDLVPIGIVLQGSTRKFQSAAEKYKEKVLGALERRHSSEGTKRKQLDLMRSSSAGRPRKVQPNYTSLDEVPFSEPFRRMEELDDFAGNVERAFQDIIRPPPSTPSPVS